MAATVLSPARALRQPRRVDLRAVFGLFLLLVATGGSIAFWSASSDTRAVLVATRDLPAGATLRLMDLAIARVRLDDAMYQAALPADAQGTAIGKQLAEPVHAQQLLVWAQVSSRPPLGPDQVALTIPVKAETAVGGRVRPGDEVQVLLTTNKGKPESRTTIVLPRVRVYDVGHDEHLTVVNTSGSSDLSTRPEVRGPLSSLTLLVTQDQALQLAQARWNGELDVALLPVAQP
jgi:Flp pilus assembly protein CpaB